MAWMRLDDNILTHPKFLAAASRLDPYGHARATYWWLALLSYCATYRTDGTVPAQLIRDVPEDRENPLQVPRSILDIFVEVGLVDRLPGGGLFMHDYADYQPTTASRKAGRARVKRHRQKRVEEDEPF